MSFDKKSVVTAKYYCKAYRAYRHIGHHNKAARKIKYGAMKISRYYRCVTRIMSRGLCHEDRVTSIVSQGSCHEIVSRGLCHEDGVTELCYVDCVTRVVSQG